MSPRTRRPDSGCGWGRYRKQQWSELDDWDRMTLATDAVLLTVRDDDLFVLLHLRPNPPHAGQWALPGVFVSYPEQGEEAVLRALRDKAGLDFDGHLERLDWSWSTERDPRGWIGCVTYLALARPEAVAAALHGREDVVLGRVVVPWTGEAGGPVRVEVGGCPVRLAFTHAEIVATSVKRLRGKLRYTDLALALVGPTFTLTELQRAYEAVLGEPQNRVTFRRLVRESLALIEPTGELEADVAHRPAELYRRRST
jgi:8-oxo-dGTP diphosphatase